MMNKIYFREIKNSKCRREREKRKRREREWRDAKDRKNKRVGGGLKGSNNVWTSRSFL